MDIKKQYNNIGKSYISLQNRFFSQNEDVGTRFIKQMLPNLKGKIVLDLGCGEGKDIKLYEGLGAKHVYGIDSSEFMVSRAKKTSKIPENIFLGEIEKIPFKDSFVDVVVGRYSFHYVENFDHAYKEIFRVLKPGGVLILIVDHPFDTLFVQKNKIYGSKEVIKLGLFDGNVPIYFPTHTFNDYFSRLFFDLFYLDYFEEGYGVELKLNKYHIPNFMGFKAIKR